ncbi:ATP-dependent nuclease [Actinobacillus vicugnae]|uniref:ATP-dependent nuclease n=1 Tax=Actinobacillus vicugnae TaxID=2573093 RepID=UPI001241C957|nr:ATP-dependent endonuclease [Actinobacillus vicugnae]
MYLQQIEISGFRGINQLKLPLRPNMVLIGENSWGKSSLLDALSHIFNLKGELYQFSESDFHQQYHPTSKKAEQIRLLFTFGIEQVDECQASIHQSYCHLFYRDQQGNPSIYLQVLGQHLNNELQTIYQFLDHTGNPLIVENQQEIIRSIINHSPVYRFKDARLNKFAPLETVFPQVIHEQDGLQSELNALSLLLHYYFLNNKSRQQLADAMQDTTLLWEKVKSLCLRLKQDQTGEATQQVRTHLSSLFIINQKLRLVEKPIILFEDLEARLHPRMIAIFWELVTYLPVQRITTTNSMELLSQVPLREISRLVRYRDHTEAFSLAYSPLGKEDLRKLTFHIHYNRGLALFSRAWILVEGETEVWILTELANLLDINLEMEGIRIVEFAQCGLRPLIKYAKAMGIEWYVLTDGDQAGKKYADIARSMLQENEVVGKHLSVIPDLDIEHFFYHEGLRNVFVRLARWQPKDNKYPTKTIIKRAIQSTSKPDLALAISNEIKQRGKQAIPRLFKKLFIKVLQLLKEQ